MTADHSPGSTTQEVRQAHPEPLFVLCPGRSYSTVTVALLAGHPDTYGFPELLLFMSETVGELQSRLDWRQLTGLYRTISELHEHSQSDGAIERAREWTRRAADWTTPRLMDYLLGTVAPRVGIENSPPTVTTEGPLALCLAAYPRARFLHLTRHPIDSIRSMSRDWKALWHPVPSDRYLLAVSATSWYSSHQRIAKTLSELPADRWLRIRAEDLLREPHTWIPKVLHWLQLPCTTEIIETMLRTERWVFSGTGPSGNLAGGSTKYLENPTLHVIPKPGAETYDTFLELPAQERQRILRLASYLGY